MFSFLHNGIEKPVNEFLREYSRVEVTENALKLEEIINAIHNEIPRKKRISYGRYSIIRDLGVFVYPLLIQKNIDIEYFANNLFKVLQNNEFVRSFGVQLMTIHANNKQGLSAALDLVEKAAADENWIVRECSAGFVRKLIKIFPADMEEWYLSMVRSDDPLKRRFASESLRPVADNKWFKKNPDFVFNIIENLFFEKAAYPRTSVGNSLSDWMRIDRELTLPIVRQLAANGDKNSYWIAYRACRNLVKKEPLLVLDMLKTDEYVYKDRRIYRKNVVKDKAETTK